MEFQGSEKDIKSLQRKM